MDDLPLVPTMKIIDYLSIEDIMNMKLVNKWFYQFINENVRIKALVISGDGIPPVRRWFYTYDLINLQNLIKYSLYDDYNLNLNKPFLSKLKQLNINRTEISLKTLNSLDQLVHLEINHSNIYRTTDNDVLSLPNNISIALGYNHLERYFDQIPENFLERFVDLRKFIVERNVNNLDQLIRVLGECKTVTSLKLSASLGQHFFDSHLYDLCPNIRTLDIIGKAVLNCEFILKFKNIEEFTVYQTESIEFATRLVKNQEDVRIEFSYFHNRDLFEIEIWKSSYGDYGIRIETEKDFLTLDSFDWPEVRRIIGLPLTEV